MAQDVVCKAQPVPVLLRAYLELMKLRIGSMIALAGVMGYVAAAGRIAPGPILGVIAALLLSSASASMVNHVWERDVDALMDRTRGRPMVTGLLPDWRPPLAVAGLLLAAGVGLAATLFNLLAAVYLLLGALVYAVVYTMWLKRRSWLNIVVGGLAGSFAVLAGGAAAGPGHWQVPAILAAVLFFWTPSHFWALAILLKDDYARARIPMLPVLIGEAATARAIFANSLLLVTCAALPWATGLAGIAYAVVSSLLGLWLLRENWRLLRRPERALARHNFFVSIQYLGGLFLAVLADAVWPM